MDISSTSPALRRGYAILGLILFLALPAHAQLWKYGPGVHIAFTPDTSQFGRITINVDTVTIRPFTTRLIDSVVEGVSSGRTYIKDGTGYGGVIDSTGALYTLNYSALNLTGFTGGGNFSGDSVQVSFGSVDFFYSYNYFQFQSAVIHCATSQGQVLSIDAHPPLPQNDSCMISVHLVKRAGPAWWLTFWKHDMESVLTPALTAGTFIHQQQLSAATFPASPIFAYRLQINLKGQ